MIWYGTDTTFSLNSAYTETIQLYNSYWYRWQYQDIQTAQGSWYGPVEMILPELEARVHTTTQGQSVYPDIALHISNYCVYCIEDQDYDTHKIIAHIFFNLSRNLFATAILEIN